jgi:formiminoglutamase
MSGASSSAVAWSTRLEPVRRPEVVFPQPDDPRLGEVAAFWQGDPPALRPGQPVLVGFPQDEGVRRNHGRVGAAEAPHEIRRWLYRLTSRDSAADVDLAHLLPLDLGNVRLATNLEESQESLGVVLGALLQAGVVPIVLGGGHETAYGHYLGYVAAGKPVGVINLDAHLDVRPPLGSHGHSGSPFRQMLEHPTAPLPDARYVCLGAQPFSVSRDHLNYVRQRVGVVRWCDEVRGRLNDPFCQECDRLAPGGPVWLSLDADVVHVADMPGVSAPNVNGLAGDEVLACVRAAGVSTQIASFELVEINPRCDRDGQSARWGALAVWHFLIGVAMRKRSRDR